MIPSMLTRLFVLLVLVLVLLLASCGGGGSDDSATPTAEEDTQAPPGDPLTAAAVDLAERFGLSADDVEFVSSTSVQWPDSCLGLPEPDEVCDQLVTPGYKVVLSLDGETYTYHTDSGTNFRAADGGASSATPSPEASGASPPDVALPPVIAAREAMAADRDVSPEEIEVITVTAREWPDACLDLPEPDEVCAQVVTPGYAVQLLHETGSSAVGSSLECTYHTDAGASVRAGNCEFSIWGG
jgi:hypothetical protein